MSSEGFSLADFEKVATRGRGYFFKPAASGVSPLNLPAPVRDAVLATPKSSAVIGDHHVQESIIRTDEFHFQYHQTFTFDLGKNGDPIPPFLVIAARDLYIITPNFSEIVSSITYENFRNLNAPDQTQRGADGVSHSPFEETSEHGGPGDQGPTGIVGQTMQLPPLYILFQTAYQSEQLPVAAEILAVRFPGVKGGRGGKGGTGGNGGRGATGTSSDCSGGYCKAGPGDGGNGGNAGKGGKGGNGGRGGNGGTVLVGAPEDMLHKYAGFIRYELTAGIGGEPGPPGGSGSYGTHGDAGFRCALCPHGANHGHDGTYPIPIDLVQVIPVLVVTRATLSHFRVITQTYSKRRMPVRCV